MSISAAADELWLIVALFAPALLALPLLLGSGILLTRLLRLRSAVIPLGFTLVVLAVALVGGSLLFDALSRPVSGSIIRKDERIVIRRQGDWRHQFNVEVQYAVGGAPVAANLKLTPAQFDSLRADAPMQLRVLPLRRSLNAVAPADSATTSRIPWAWFIGVAGVAGLGWAILRVGRSAGVAVLAGLTCLAALGIPLWPAFTDWRSLTTPATRPLTATATVHAVTDVTVIDPLPCRPQSGRNCERRIDTAFTVPQPYTVVELRFTPQGRREAVLAVASADAGSVSLRPGEHVTVAYAPDAPRDARLPAAGHRHRWLNPLAAVGVVVAPFGLIALLLGTAVMRLRRRRPLAHSRSTG